MKNIVPKKHTENNALKSALRQARAAALQQELKWYGTVPLSIETFNRFNLNGWSRTDVETAVNDCVNNGSITIESKGAFMWLRLTTAKSEVSQ